MSFTTYPAALPYFEELHKEALLKDLIAKLVPVDDGTESKVDKQEEVLEVDGLDINNNSKFMEAFDEVANQTWTTNGALTNASTRDDIIDLSYGIDSVQPEGRHAMLKAAWEQDPEMTLHIIFYTRSIHRGKSLGKAFFNAYSWLLLHHPRTALANLHVLIDGTVRTDAELEHTRRQAKQKAQAEVDGWEAVEEKHELLTRRDFKTHGCWKDLLVLATIYCQGQVGGISYNEEYRALVWPPTPRNKASRSKAITERNKRYNQRCKMTPEEAAKNLENFKKMNVEHNKKQEADAKEKRLQERQKRNQVVSDLLEKDKIYRALHFSVARLFADQLVQDRKQLEQNKQANLKGRHALGFNLSMAAKWAPSLCKSFDKHTLLATTIAELLFPPHKYQEKDESRVHYLNKARELYRKEYLVPLRSAMDITEHYMSPGQWNKVDFRHIPSVCLQQNIGNFFKHAPDAVVDYMSEVARGAKKVSGATLGPNELVYRACNSDLPKSLMKVLKSQPDLSEKFMTSQEHLVNGQWDTLIKSIRDTSLLAVDKEEGDGKTKKKKVDLGECLAICDVSGSMMCGGDKPQNQPMFAAIGLSLVITNLAKRPFNGAVVTFTDRPQAFKVDTDKPFSDQVKTVMSSEVGFNTDICRVFTDVLLPMAKKHKLAPEDMVKRLFIFTDMEFDADDNGMDSYLTTHEFIKKQYQEAGYKVPELVWWNLCNQNVYRSSKEMTVPVTKSDTGVSLLSGFSAAMIKSFLDGDVDDEVDDDNSKPTGDEEKEDDGQNENDTAMDFLKKSVYHESFNGIVVVD
ncbi:conserved hypothetical protein [Mucor ambiguus]|uniref:Uncharacterized protein n=1 Tax=Mucor ambiguus TaxID=91626 RepID=A0A0C9MQ58_9FUNG|nr:conserved hypothetical protein [Mucor ambiguus]